MEKYLFVTVEEQMHGMTVEKILRDNLGLTKKQISRAKFRPDGICKNNVQCRVTEKGSLGDEIRVCLETEEVQSIQLVSGNDSGEKLDILYEDEDILAVDKPAGVLTHPSGIHYSDSLANQAAAYFRKKNLSVCIRPVGRLDKETSGIVLFAKNQVAAQRLQEQREVGILEKEYLALVTGNLPTDQEDIWHTIDYPVQKIGDHPLRMKAVKEKNSAESMADSNYFQAVTHYHVLYSTDKWSAVKVKLDTGRTHQIRVHMQAIRHPLIGDSLYNIPIMNRGQCTIYRAALHAWKVRFCQPFTGRKMELEAPVPEDFKKYGGFYVCSGS